MLDSKGADWRISDDMRANNATLVARRPKNEELVHLEPRLSDDMRAIQSMIKRLSDADQYERSTNLATKRHCLGRAAGPMAHNLLEAHHQFLFEVPTSETQPFAAARKSWRIVRIPIPSITQRFIEKQLTTGGLKKDNQSDALQTFGDSGGR